MTEYLPLILSSWSFFGGMIYWGLRDCDIINPDHDNWLQRFFIHALAGPFVFAIFLIYAIYSFLGWIGNLSK